MKTINTVEKPLNVWQENLKCILETVLIHDRNQTWISLSLNLLMRVLSFGGLSYFCIILYNFNTESTLSGL